MQASEKGTTSRDPAWRPAIRLQLQHSQRAANPKGTGRSFKTEQRVDEIAGDDLVIRATPRGPPKILRKEVIQPQVPLRLPCYDFTPVTSHSLGACLLAVSAATSGATDSHGVTGGVYKARERIHRGVLIRDY